MKRFSCGDVVPGCQVRFRGDSDEDILSQVAVHARDDHGMSEIGPDVMQAVLQNIHSDGLAA